MKDKETCKALKKAYDESPPIPKTRRDDGGPFGREMRKLITAGELAVAGRQIRERLERASSAREKAIFYELLSEAYLAANNEQRGGSELWSAIEQWEEAGLDQKSLSEMRDQYISLVLKQDWYIVAHALIDKGLYHDPTAASLWHRSGLLYWYEHRYSLAYAALSTAALHKYPKAPSIAAKAGVLADWGHYNRANTELDKLLSQKGLSDTQSARAHTTRGYIASMQGDRESALSEFAIAERTTPNDAWLHYYRATCYYSDPDQLFFPEDTEKAKENLIRALEANEPKLNLVKLQHTGKLLTRLGVRVDWYERLTPVEEVSYPVGIHRERKEVRRTVSFPVGIHHE